MVSWAILVLVKGIVRLLTLIDWLFRRLLNKSLVSFTSSDFRKTLSDGARGELSDPDISTIVELYLEGLAKDTHLTFYSRFSQKRFLRMQLEQRAAIRATMTLYPAISAVRSHRVTNELWTKVENIDETYTSGADPGRGRPPPFFGPRCRLFNIGSRAGPPLFVCRPTLDAPFQKSRLRTCTACWPQRGGGEDKSMGGGGSHVLSSFPPVTEIKAFFVHLCLPFVPLIVYMRKPFPYWRPRLKWYM